MKALGRVIAALLVLVASVSCSCIRLRATRGAVTEPASPPRLITVTGDAEVRVVPDEIVLTLGVQTWDTDLGVAKAQNDAIVREVLGVASEFKIDPGHIQTEYVNIEPRYRDGYEKRDFIGYFVSKTVVITLRDVTLFEDLLSSMLAAGVNYVHGVQFRTTELRRHKDEARALAITAAREKAQALAAELGQQVGEPQSIVEDQVGWWSSYGAWWGSYWGGGVAQNVVQDVGVGSVDTEGALAPGRITVRARVTVGFELE